MNRIFQKWLALGVLSIAVTGGAACATPQGRLYVRTGPPAPIVEVRGVAPGPNFVWVNGYHHWSGSAFVWTPGHWIAAPRPGSHWVPGHWEHDRRGWFFIEGRWR